jgi:hypothetical protein
MACCNVITFLDKSDVYNSMDGKKYHQHILLYIYVEMLLKKTRTCMSYITTEQTAIYVELIQLPTSTTYARRIHTRNPQSDGTNSNLRRTDVNNLCPPYTYPEPTIDDIYNDGTNSNLRRTDSPTDVSTIDNFQQCSQIVRRIHTRNPQSMTCITTEQTAIYVDEFSEPLDFDGDVNTWYTGTVTDTVADLENTIIELRTVGTLVCCATEVNRNT